MRFYLLLREKTMNGTTPNCCRAITWIEEVPGGESSCISPATNVHRIRIAINERHRNNVQTSMCKQRGHNFQLMHHCAHLFLPCDSGSGIGSTLSNQSWSTTLKLFLEVISRGTQFYSTPQATLKIRWSLISNVLISSCKQRGRIYQLEHH